MIFLSYDKGESKDMKKKNMIIIGVIALILVITIGYALFSDTLKINGTATAKGDFSITTTCTPGLTHDEFLNSNIFNNAPEQDNNYANDNCSVNDNKITYSTELLQPGAVRNFTIKIKNTGSIDVVTNVDTGYTSNVQSCIGNYDTGEFSECVNNSQATQGLYTGTVVGFEKNDGTTVFATEDNVDEISNFFDEEFENIILEPGESMYFVASSEWSNLGSAIEGNKKVLYKEIITDEFTFTQPIK